MVHAAVGREGLHWDGIALVCSSYSGQGQSQSSALGRSGEELTVQNFIWRGDNFLYGARWDQLLSMRDKTDLVEVVSWNDYGESTYINEITGDMPQAVKD